MPDETWPAERAARAMFVGLLRQRREGVNFTIIEHSNSWELKGRSYLIREIAITFFKDNSENFEVFLGCNVPNKERNVVLRLKTSADTNKQAAWLVQWLLNEEELVPPKK